MRVTRGLSRYRRAAHPVVTIGNFDGHHLGHQALLRTVVETATARAGTPIVLTFDPHPIRVLAPDVDFRLLTSVEEKLERCEHAGIREVLVLEFNRELAAMPPDDFVIKILGEGIGVKELFVGEHFAYGKNRGGRMADLVRLGPQVGFQVHAVVPVRVDGQVVSSTRVRQLVQAGEVRAAARYLGRPYALGGTVVAGERRGRELGWPTANVQLPPQRVIPADGVYATTAICKGRHVDSVTYIGSRPTFGVGERLLEVFVLDDAPELYGEVVHMQFVDRLRGDLHFDSAEALSAQIELDVGLARQMLHASDRVGSS